MNRRKESEEELLGIAAIAFIIGGLVFTVEASSTESIQAAEVTTLLIENCAYPTVFSVSFTTYFSSGGVATQNMDMEPNWKQLDFDVSADAIDEGKVVKYTLLLQSGDDVSQEIIIPYEQLKGQGDILVSQLKVNERKQFTLEYESE